MRRTLVLVIASGIAGAIISVFFSSRDQMPATMAQVAAPGGFPAEAPAPAVPGGAGAPAGQGGPGGPIDMDAAGRASMPGRTDVDDLTPEERVNVSVYESANRAVVHVTTAGYRGDRFLFMELPSAGEGSGAVIDRQGHIVTNYHVVEGAQQIEVTLFNDKTYEGRMVGHDPVTDVAVIKVNAPPDDLFPVTFGDSSRLRVGQRIFALGNPFGYDRTLSTGIISSLDRWIPSRRKIGKIKQIIQIDASINPGSSGGPLLDSHSRMIGMNTAIASKTGESTGVGFAIPINTIARVVPQLIRSGRVVRGEIGIDQVFQTDHGVFIARLTPGGAAERAGLLGPRVVRQRQGPFVYQSTDRSTADRIAAIDGQPVKTAEDVLDAIENRQPGDQVVVTVVRKSQELQFRIRLDTGG
jgi:S1-C subfamily serine protease